MNALLQIGTEHLPARFLRPALQQLKENADVQKLAVSAIEKYIDNIPLQSEKTLDVTCEAVKGSDGKFRWAPKDLKVFKDFIRGQN